MVIFSDVLQQLGFQLQYHPLKQIPYILPPLCTIPAGAFLMGSNPEVDKQAQSEECPQHSVWLSTYHIGKYPVTVAEYACAIEAQAPGVGKPSGMRLEAFWDEQLLNPTRPVYGLTWYDALGYARWLSQMTNLAWRLPTEAEWEKAARGTDGRIYPWGSQWDARNANMCWEESQSGEQSTTPIDAYAHAASPYGVIDMAGNVEEWTSTISDNEEFPYPYKADDGREDIDKYEHFRRLRGGCWLFDPPTARAAFRSFFSVNDRYDWLNGMRLACSETP